jgi:hypothetical protein
MTTEQKDTINTIPLWNRLQRYYKVTLPMTNTYTTTKCTTSLATYYHGDAIAYLYLSNSGQVVFIVNNEMIPSRSRFSDKLCNSDILFKGYIADGTFYILDILTYQGHTVDMKLTDKLILINTLLDYNYRPDPVLDLYTIKFVDFVENCHVDSYLEQAPRWCNGLLYYPEHGLPLLVKGAKPSSTASKMAKQLEIISVPNPNVVVSFQLNKTSKPDVYNLYLYDKTLSFYDIASIPDKTTSHLVHRLLHGRSSAVINCMYDPNFGRWIPVALASSEPDTYQTFRTKNLVI